MRQALPDAARSALAEGAPIVVTSPSAFDAVRASLASESIIVAIGRTTAHAVRRAGLPVAATAAAPDADGVVAALDAADQDR